MIRALLISLLLSWACPAISQIQSQKAPSQAAAPMPLAAADIPQQAGSNAVSLAWLPSSAAAGYKVYWGPASRHYTNHVSTASTNITLALDPDAYAYWLSATAFNAAGVESDFSNEVTTAPLTNVNVIVRVATSTTLTGPKTLLPIAPLLNVTNPPGNLFFHFVITGQRF